MQIESGAGQSQSFTIQVTGLNPPRIEGPPVLNTQLAFPFRVYSDAGRYNLLLAAFNNQPSVAPSGRYAGSPQPFLLQL